MNTDKDTKILKKVQKTQLEILNEFDRICQENNLRYQLFSGTLLGAIRHQGVIPWDDDIDVCMLREDYEKFINIYYKELKSQYFLQTCDTDPEYIMHFAKIRKNDTLFIEQATADCNIHKGVYIDVFPLDNVEPNKLAGRIQLLLIFLLGRLNLCRVKTHCLNAKTPLKRFSSLCGHYILKIVPKNFSDNFLEKLYCLLINKQTDYVSHLTNGVSKKRIEMFLREKKTFNDIEFSKFGENLFPIPKNYDDVLKRHYGNYMELPPVEKRIAHHGIIEVKV